ncbi:MAG: hypothetical protein MMC23_004588 [Stictis urceolatum]|nr:hypothetical protein [Stictis urceolata]
MFSRVAFTKAQRHIAPSVLLLSSSFAYYNYNYRQDALRSDAPTRKQWDAQQSRDSGTATNYSEKVSASGNILGTGHGGNQNSDNKEGKSWFGDGDDAAWSSFSKRFSEAGASIAKFEWSSLGDRITDTLLPDWALVVPGYIRKLQSELDSAPGSLTDEIWREADDPYINPEIQWNARVRIGKELCAEEVAFKRRRKEHTTRALAKYLDIPEGDIDPDDVPTIAVCGSGGGLRALVAGTSSYLCTQEAGLFDCVTYTAGVSGSCWLQTLYLSSLAGQDFQNLINHLKKRLGTHFAFPPTALSLLATAPTNKFLLSGLMEKVKADPNADFGLVDIYGLLLGARLLVPRGELEIEPRDLKISNQRSHIDDGTHPLPIYTAVRHEIPLGQYDFLKTEIRRHPPEAMKKKAEQESWFQWFEWTPYEFWCDEIDAGIPTWSLGRQFHNGVNVPRENGLGLPEMRLPQLLGIWGSAFCATLSHYYKEIQPIVKGLAGFAGVDDLISERDNDLSKVHPIGPATIPNYVLGLEDQLPPTTPASMFKSSHLQLMDAGMSNNLPIYPLLRPGRDVDILIAFDASADIKQENWLSVADGYAKQRAIKGWPVGAGWPREDEDQGQIVRELEGAQATTTQEAATKVTEAKAEQSVDDGAQSKNSNAAKVQEQKRDLGYCTVWIGTTEQRSASSSSPPSKRIDDSNAADWDLLQPEDSGIAVIYFPFVPNPKVPGVDPATSPFMSTWNSVYTPEEIDKVVALAKANFNMGKDQTRRCVRAIYERKKRLRLEREEEAEKERWRRRFKGEGDPFRG